MCIADGLGAQGAKKAAKTMAKAAGLRKDAADKLKKAAKTAAAGDKAGAKAVRERVAWQCGFQTD